MLKTLFFSMLLNIHPGWVDKPAPWVQQAQPQELVQTGTRIAQPVLQARQSFPGPIWQQAAKTHGVDPVLLESDTKAARGARPYVMANLRHGNGVAEITDFLIREGGL